MEVEGHHYSTPYQLVGQQVEDSLHRHPWWRFFTAASAWPRIRAVARCPDVPRGTGASARSLTSATANGTPPACWNGPAPSACSRSAWWKDSHPSSASGSRLSRRRWVCTHWLANTANRGWNRPAPRCPLQAVPAGERALHPGHRLDQQPLPQLVPCAAEPILHDNIRGADYFSAPADDDDNQVAVSAEVAG